MKNIHVDYLANHPHTLGGLADAIHSQWKEMYARRGETRNDVRQKLQARAVTDRIPFTLVAVDGDTVVGSITVKEKDFPARPDLGPWIAGVFVKQSHRGQGISRQLLKTMEDKLAADFNISTVWLYTGSAEGLYTKTGYTLHEQVSQDGRSLVIMKKNLQ
ncbi:MAG: GNAT family N-acetyltransferase [Fibrobacterota bacterium]